MSLISPILPYLGPVGQILSTNSNDILSVGLGLLGLISLGLYKVKKEIFQTSKSWVGATVVLSFLTILFRGMGAVCGCTWYTDPNTGAIQQLVPITYLLIAGSFFAILYNFNIAIVKKHKWLFSIPLSIPLSIVSNMFFPLVTNTPPWLVIEIVILAPLGAIYSSFVYEKAVLHMGDYRARMRRFLEQGDRAKKGGVELPREKQGFSYILPSMKVGSRRQRLDNFLPFTASYMTVLASAGVTPERILRSTAEKDPKFMLSDEIANVIGRIDLLGYDVINAMNAEVERSPSANYQDLLRGFAGVIRTGGDMKKFFQGITDHLFQKRALSVQGFLDTLGIIAETYVLMLIAFPLMLVVMLSIMASIGGNLGGIDVFSFMYLLAFILIPICGVMFLFILDTMQPKG